MKCSFSSSDFWEHQIRRSDQVILNVHNMRHFNWDSVSWVFLYREVAGSTVNSL